MENSEVETIVCAMALRDPKFLAEAVSRGLKPSHFQLDLHGQIFQAAVSLWEKNAAFSLADIIHAIGRQHLTAVSDIRTRVPIALNAKPHLQAMLDNGRQQELQAKLLDIGRQLSNRKPLQPLAPIIAGLGDLVVFASGTSEAIRTVGMADALDASLAAAEARAIASGLPGIPTGLPTLDAITYGFQPGFVYTLGARTSVGKSMMAVNMALSAAEAGFKTAFVTVEMAATDICDRMLGKVSRVNLGKYLSGAMSEDELDRIVRGAETMHKLPILFTEVLTPEVDHLAFEAMRLVRAEDVKLLIIDYLQLFEVGDGKFRQAREDAKTVVTRIKRMARLLNVPILVLSQLNREAPEKGEPDLKHIAETDQIARDSDVVMFLYTDDHDDYYLSVAKQRRGRRGQIKLVADMNYGSFTEGGIR